MGPGDVRVVDVLLEVGGQHAVRVDTQLAVLASARLVDERLVAPVDLRAVPPVACRRCTTSAARRRVCGRVARRPPDLHRWIRPGVALVERDQPRLLRVVGAVAEPVVHLELQPGCREHVQRRGRNELLARVQLRLTVRGFGVSRRGSVSGYVCSRAKFRPKRVPVLPISGLIEVVEACRRSSATSDSAALRRQSAEMSARR